MANFWYWLAEEKTAFIAGQRVRDPQTQYNLPRFAPTLGSGRDIFDVCGKIKYTFDITLPRYAVFRNLQPIGEVTDVTPTVEVFSDDPTNVSLDPDYDSFFGWTFKCKFVRYADDELTYPEVV